MWSIFQAIKRSWLKHFVTQISAFLILLATYVAALSIILATTNMRSVFEIWGKVSDITIYLQQSASEKDVEKLKSHLASHEKVQGFEYIDSQKSAEDFNQRLKDLGSELFNQSTIQDFFPANIKVNLNKPYSFQADKLNLSLFSNALKERFSFVSDVSYGQNWLNQYSKVLLAVEKVNWMIVLAIFFCSLFVAANVIKTVLFSRRDEVEILEFVGETPMGIYGPHIVNCLLLSLIAYLLATVVVAGLFHSSLNYARSVLPAQITGEFQFLSPLAWTGFLGFILVSVYFYSLSAVSSMAPTFTGGRWWKK
ncbi:MAG: permease-like cell division protein FtsX [Bdellovibrionales bacterium]|nr:permease-like cell division protein FtsX [Bdellovibrionales bacterium]